MTKKYYILINNDEVYDHLYSSHHGARTRLHIDKDKGWELLEITLEDFQQLKRMKGA